MSLFDEIVCKMPLPDDAPAFVKKYRSFQTCDLGRGMGQYTIDEDRQLYCEFTVSARILKQALGIDKLPRVSMFYRRKRIEMAATNMVGGGPVKGNCVPRTKDGSDCINIVYVVQIRDGKVSSIKEKHRSCEPALPAKS